MGNLKSTAVDWRPSHGDGDRASEKAKARRTSKEERESIGFVSTSTFNTPPLLVRTKLGVKRKMRAAGNKSVGGGCPFSAMTSSSATERLPLERTTAPAKNVTKREGARRPPAPPGGPFGPAALKIVAGLALEGKSKTTLQFPMVENYTDKPTQFRRAEDNAYSG